MEAIRYEHIKFRDNWVWRSDDGESCYRSGVIYGQVHYSELSGSGKPHHIQEVSSVLEAAYREGGLAGKEFIRIADYSKLKHASLTTRKAYAKLLNDLNEKYDCHPVVTYICGASFFARNAMRLFAAFVRQKFIFLDSVEDAFARIRDNLDLLPRTPISAKDIIFKDEWRYENKESGYGYSFGIVPGRLFYYQRKGKATLDEVKQVFESVLPRIMQESEFDNRSIDFIWEISGREGLSMPVRRYIFRSLQSVQKRHNAKLTNIYICGKRGALYVVMNVLAKALGVKICFVPTFEDALARMAGKVSVGKVLPSHERLVTEEHIQEIDDYFGQLLFAGEEIPLPPCPVSPDNPLNSLKELIDAARVDLQELRENDLRLTKTLREEIRERERSEAMLIQAERLSAVGTLAGGVAHEYNNLNCIILGFAELGLTLSGLPEGAADSFQRIVNAGRRASVITRRLLDFACPSSGNWTRGDLPTVVRGALDMMRHEMQSSGVEIVEDLRPVPPTPMDEHMIGQVVLNLLINALHAMTDRENKRLELSCGEESGKLFFRVADNGCGMDEETQKQIFTPFFSRKGEHSLTESPMRKLRGSGLGLSICYTIVKKHDGQIECKSEPEKGTVFTVRISLRKATDCELPECHSAELAPAASGFGRMLILDDEQDICDLIQSVFVGDGMEVESLADGHQALQRCAEKMIDIVLLDLQMPAMDGVTFLNRLRKLPGIAQPKVIVMSGKTRTLNAFETEAYNVACVLEKPFAINALRKAVLSCLS